MKTIKHDKRFWFVEWVVFSPRKYRECIKRCSTRQEARDYKKLVMKRKSTYRAWINRRYEGM